MQPSGYELTQHAGYWKLPSAPSLPLQCSHGPEARLNVRNGLELNQPQVRMLDGFVPRRTGAYSIRLQKKRPRVFRGRLQFLLGKELCGYGLVVVVVVVSSCLITAGGWGWARTTFRTTTRSPTVE
jgi:hypothetical protein